jgi:manganese efflux pump family protein
MDYWEIIALAIGLSMDAMAVAIACSISLRKVSKRQVFRFAFHFGLFQAFMPILGWYAGTTVHDLILSWDHWLAFFLLSYVGGKAIHESFKNDNCTETQKDPTRGMSLVVFSVATSIDALAVGLSLSAIDVKIWQPAIIIGLITASLTTAGMLFSSKVGVLFGTSVKFIGGLILLGIGLKILLSHLLS